MDPALEQFQFIWSAAGDYGLKILISLLIWFIGSTVAKVAGDGISRVLRYQDSIDPSVANFASRATRWIGLIIIAVLVLGVFGVNTTSIAAVLGAMTLAIGLALRETLANVAAGVMILMVRPFLTGHYVQISDNKGIVRAINLFNTELVTVDNIQVFVPNNEVWKSAIRNYSAFDRRRMDVVIGIGYDSDTDKAIAVARRLIDADPRALQEPEPFVRVTELADSSVNLTLRVWCMSHDVHNMKFDLLKAIKEQFELAGVSIPYPHLEVIHRPASTYVGPGSDTTLAELSNTRFGV